MKLSRQKYKGYQVLKIDKDGNVVEQYDSMHMTQQIENISHTHLKHVIDKGIEVNGFVFRFGTKNQSYQKDKADSTSTPWEDKGFFNIDGWAKATF